MGKLSLRLSRKHSLTLSLGLSDFRTTNQGRNHSCPHLRLPPLGLSSCATGRYPSEITTLPFRVWIASHSPSEHSNSSNYQQCFRAHIQSEVYCPSPSYINNCNHFCLFSLTQSYILLLIYLYSFSLTFKMSLYNIKENKEKLQSLF